MIKLLQIDKKKHAQTENLTDLTNKVAEILEKVYDFLLGRMSFTVSNVYENVLVFAPILISLILDRIKRY